MSATSPGLESFLAAVQAGYVYAGAGGPTPSGLLVDGLAPLDPRDPEAVTAEAYNQEILDPDTPWEDGLAMVREGLA